MTLDELPRDDRAVVTRLDIAGPQRRRLMDLGLLPGIEVRADRTSPLGDPTAYSVRGAVIVLRRSQACAIHVERLHGRTR
jgi:ferrous iron transport protein A